MRKHVHKDKPCTDGRVEVCGGRNLGFDRHNVQIHQVEEVQMKDAAICGKKVNITAIN